MRILMAAVGLAMAIGAASAGAKPADAAPPPVKVELLADVSAVQPGKTFRVGVLMKMPPGWHVYWKNAGETGVPTSVEWKLPEGFIAGELMWPTPVRFPQPGDISAFGYEGSVLLMATVTAPANLPAGKALDFSAKVEWLQCEKACVPGEAEPKLRLSVGEAKPANEQVFQQFAARVPAGTEGALGKAKVEGKNAGAGLSRWTLTIEWTKAPQQVEFFADAEPALEVGDVAIKTEGGLSIITFSTRTLEGQKLERDSLPVVVSWRDGEELRGLAINVQLKGL